MSDKRAVDGGRLWVGGAMAGVVGAGVAVVGLLIARGIFDIPVLVQREGELVNASTWWYASTAFVCALIATALLHVLLAAAPRPFTFYGWITGLAIAISALLPFTTGAEIASKVATSLINLTVGIVIASTIATVGRSAVAASRQRPADRPGDSVTPW